MISILALAECFAQGASLALAVYLAWKSRRYQQPPGMVLHSGRKYANVVFYTRTNNMVKINLI